MSDETPGGDPTERLASPTLAQLYLTQGRLKGALKILRTLLSRDRFHGGALELLRRASLREEASLQIRVERGELAIRYAIPELSREPGRPGAGAHVMVSIHRLPGKQRHLAPRITSRACTADRGTVRIPVPPGSASAAVCVARRDGPTLQVLGVAEVVSW